MIKMLINNWDSTNVNLNFFKKLKASNQNPHAVVFQRGANNKGPQYNRDCFCILPAKRTMNS